MTSGSWEALQTEAKGLTHDLQRVAIDEVRARRWIEPNVGELASIPQKLIVEDWYWWVIFATDRTRNAIELGIDFEFQEEN